MNTTEDNKLIAEFMELPTEVFNSGLLNYYHREYNSGTWYEEHELSYNVSWDWLEPVVEKIEMLEYTFEKNYQRLDKDWQCLIVKGNDIMFQEFNINSKLAAYNAVVEFIKWYNENKGSLPTNN